MIELGAETANCFGTWIVSVVVKCAFPYLNISAVHLLTRA